MKPIDIINEFYKHGSKSHEILLRHSEAVAQKALRVAGKIPDLKPDTCFIEEAAMIHDIGIFYTNAPSIGCHGKYPYVCHGYLGRKLMEDLGYHRHALVCERHVGAGLSVDDINKFNLPLPARNMIPISIEEQIICYVDKFFSKKLDKSIEELSTEAVVKKIEAYGSDQAMRFKAWVDLFG
ncbi:MAG: phosphohydrolase [Desulfobacteraceae bacterium]|nr:phosphohydrolase [Desulfobacteraceae bacterium]MBC2754963.1 phosphohydrolase [Desulfobacteraceae bacterium]